MFSIGLILTAFGYAWLHATRFKSYPIDPYVCVGILVGLVLMVVSIAIKLWSVMP